MSLDSLPLQRILGRTLQKALDGSASSSSDRTVSADSALALAAGALSVVNATEPCWTQLPEGGRVEA